jgi:hypothetical protein
MSMKSPRTTPLSRPLMTSKLRFTCDGTADVYAHGHFSQLSSPFPAPIGYLRTKNGAEV